MPQDASVEDNQLDGTLATVCHGRTAEKSCQYRNGCDRMLA
jgi:hypothetical protein